MPENVCPHCKAKIPKREFICPACGLDIREWKPDMLRCPICRAFYPKGTKFCLKDGSSLEPAIVDFDTEATIFLPGSLKESSLKKADLIPRIKFAPEPDRVIPKLERDKSGHIAHPKKSPPPPKSEPEIIMPEISFGVSAPVEPPTEPPPPSPATSPPVTPSSATPSPVQPPEPRTYAPPPPPPKPKKLLKVKPLEEYERLLREEEEREARLKAVEFIASEMKKVVVKKPRGFFRRLYAAFKILVGK